jgi:hypothetical protein
MRAPEFFTTESGETDQDKYRQCLFDQTQNQQFTEKGNPTPAIEVDLSPTTAQKYVGNYVYIQSVG